MSKSIEEIDAERKEILDQYANYFGDDEKRAELRKRLTDLHYQRNALQIKELQSGRDLFTEQRQS